MVGGESCHDDSLRCPHHSLYTFPVWGVGGPKPDRDAAGQCALCCPSVESGEDGRGEVCSSHPVQKVQTVLCSLHETRGVKGPGQSVCDLHPQEFGSADLLHCGVIDEEGV